MRPWDSDRRVSVGEILSEKGLHKFMLAIKERGQKGLQVNETDDAFTALCLFSCYSTRSVKEQRC